LKAESAMKKLIIAVLGLILVAGAGVVPAGGWRRFSLLYAVPPGEPVSVQYRGFESTGTFKVR
jgi:hypothetical protein